MVDPVKTVHVVDDDESVRKALGRLLKSAGYIMQAFASAEDFLGQANLNLVKCLVLDVQLTGMSGIDLQERLCAGNFSIPIVFITAHETPQALSRDVTKGAATILRKPFDEKLLLNAIALNFQQLNARNT